MIKLKVISSVCPQPTMKEKLENKRIKLKILSNCYSCLDFQMFSLFRELVFYSALLQYQVLTVMVVIVFIANNVINCCYYETKCFCVCQKCFKNEKQNQD